MRGLDCRSAARHAHLEPAVQAQLQRVHERGDDKQAAAVLGAGVGALVGGGHAVGTGAAIGAGAGAVGGVATGSAAWRENYNSRYYSCMQGY